MGRKQLGPDDFRRLALALPEAEEHAHRGHPDFRVGGKVFATLGHPDAAWAMVKLTPEEQALFVEQAPATFEPVPGGWGPEVRKGGGATRLRLAAVDTGLLRSALLAAWRGRAPKRLVAATAT